MDGFVLVTPLFITSQCNHNNLNAWYKSKFVDHAKEGGGGNSILYPISTPECHTLTLLGFSSKYKSD